VTLDTRIEASLKAAIDAEPSNTPSPLANVMETALGRRRRERIVAWTLSGLALLAVVFTLTIQTGVEPSDVAEDDVSLSKGEVLLSTDPVVVVQGAASPEPQFDTANLGVEQPLTPLTDLGRIEAVVELHVEYAVDPEVLRITTVGTTVGGQDTVILHLYETDRFSDRRLQLRCTLPSGGCFGEFLDDPSIDPEQLLQPDPRDEPTFEVGSPGHVTWDAPPGTSVVVLTVNGDPVWQRPISGVSVFDTQLVDGDRFEIKALDERGVALIDHAFTASNG
jgi:hypothetical protein